MATFRRCIKNFDKVPDVYNYYGELLLDQQMFKEAIEKFETALEMEKQTKPLNMNVLPLVNKALASFQRDRDFAEAEKLLQKALIRESPCQVLVLALTSSSRPRVRHRCCFNGPAASSAKQNSRRAQVFRASCGASTDTPRSSGCAVVRRGYKDSARGTTEVSSFNVEITGYGTGARSLQLRHRQGVPYFFCRYHAILPVSTGVPRLRPRQFSSEDCRGASNISYGRCCLIILSIQCIAKWSHG